MREQPGPSFPPVAQAAHSVKDVPVFCHDYGHSWESTKQPDVKHCSLCGMNGYCPGCTPTPPANAKPFSCTRHAAQAESAVQHG